MMGRNSSAQMRALVPEARKLSAELFTATLAAGAQNFATTSGGLACKKAMAPGAHKIAGLESPLHIILEIEIRHTAQNIVRMPKCRRLKTA